MRRTSLSLRELGGPRYVSGSVTSSNLQCKRTLCCRLDAGPSRGSKREAVRAAGWGGLGRRCGLSVGPGGPARWLCCWTGRVTTAKPEELCERHFGCRGKAGVGRGALGAPQTPRRALFCYMPVWGAGGVRCSRWPNAGPDGPEAPHAPPRRGVGPGRGDAFRGRPRGGETRSGVGLSGSPSPATAGVPSGPDHRRFCPCGTRSTTRSRRRR